NPESRIPTTHINQLAREGMQFRDAHSPCTVCTPTRYSLMTGQMAFRIPNGGTVFTGAGGPSLISADRLTLPELLKQQGYETACFGKWHIGWTFRDAAGQPIHNGSLQAIEQIDYSRRVEGGPIDCGFDHFFGTACCPTTDWLYAFIEQDRIPVPPTQRLDKTGLPDHPYGKDNRPGWIAPDFNLEEVDEIFLEKSCAFLRTHAQSKPQQPFFLYHAMQAVHLPSFAGKTYQGKTNAGPHGDFIYQLDQTVGKLLATLQELKLDQNTLVILTSDNGPEVTSVYHMRHDHQHDGARPWRGVKRDNWEGGHRVPFLARWPGIIAAGSSSQQIISLCDLFATAAEITGSALPDDAAEDSFSLLAEFRGEQKTPLHPYLLQQGFGGQRYLAIRRGKWKYLAHKGSGGNNYEKSPLLKEYAIPDNAPQAPGQLYDLDQDPGETVNLALEHPQIAAELQALLQESIASGRSRPTNPITAP
ncbi:MAG: arylsulfatase, partial [Planctomycetaceae bacterium]|nr:arylsulfatase [Planctomycetaceae bacterium]